MLSLAVGCSEDSSLLTISGDAITFDAPSFKDEVTGTTRATIVSAFASGDSFGTFAYHNYNLTNTTSTIMSNQMVTKGSDGSWSYSPTQYWDVATTSTYDFYAYAPHESTATTAYNDTTEKPQLTYAPSTTVTNQVDLLFAEPLTGLTSQSGDVKFDFNHALTAIQFEAKVLDESVTGLLYKIELQGIYASATADIDGETIEWSYPETPTTANYSAALNFDEEKTYRTISSTTATTDLTPDDGVLLLLPQTLPSTALLVATLTVNGVDNVEVSFSFPTDTAWSANTKVTYTITFGTTVSVTYSVEAWSTTDVNYDTIGDLIYAGTINTSDKDWNTTTDSDQNIGDLALDSGIVTTETDDDWVEKDEVDSSVGGETEYDDLTTSDDGWGETSGGSDSLGDTSIDGDSTDTVETTVEEDWDENYSDSATIGGTGTED